MDRTTDILMSVKNLEIQYCTDGEVVHAVNGINLELHKGETLGLVGETGAGKTTTVLSMLRLLPKYVGKVASGEIWFHGEDLLKASESHMREIRGKQISMIFQDPMTSLNPIFTVGNQIAEVIHLHNRELTRGQVDEQVQEILQKVGIPPERRNEYPNQFSGGMKQRVMIAIAIACQPELLIADEPTSALDVTIQAQVIKMMRDLKNELNSSVILITHDLGIVANFCDSVAIMYAGEIVEYGTLEEIFDRNRPHHPYTVGLFGAIPDISRSVTRLSPIPGLMPNPANLPQGCKFHPRCPICMDACKLEPIKSYRSGTHEILCRAVWEQKGDGSHE